MLFYELKLFSKGGYVDVHNFEGTDPLDQALRKVTEKCQYIGLLCLCYVNRPIGHSVVFFKKEDQIEVYDPQAKDWWTEDDYSKISRVFCYEIDREVAEHYLEECREDLYSKLDSCRDGL